METERNAAFLLVLVPHRDARRQLRDYSGALFRAGLSGAWSFPWVSPLAVLSRPLAGSELKRIAAAIREQNRAADGKISCGQETRAAETGSEFPAGTAAIFGLPLNCAISDSALCADGIRCRLSPLVMGAALVYKGQALPPALPRPPEISFRAAAIANMSYSPLEQNGAYPPESFKWKIGELYWLPPVKKATGKNSGTNISRNGL